LHDEGAPVVVREALADPLDGLHLAHAPGDGGARGRLGELFARRAAKDEGLEARLAVVPVDLARRVASATSGAVGSVVPDVNLGAVRVEDDRALPVLGLEGVRVEGSLRAALLGLEGGALGLDHRERLAVVAPQHVIDEPAAALAAG